MNDTPHNIEQPLIMVTGAAGFVGRRVVARLAQAGARVIAVDRVPLPGDLPPGVEFRWAEVGQNTVETPGAFTLVHLAWSMDRADPKAQENSVADFRRLLETNGLQGVVGLGSAEEYGELEGCLSENMAPGLQLSAYGKAKSAACRMLAAWSQRTERAAIWLRPFIVYGPGQKGDMVIPYALRCAQEHVAAEFSEGQQFRDFVHVEDVAAGVALAALRLPQAGNRWAVCNLGRGEPVRVRTVLERMAELTAAQARFHFGVRPMRADEPQTQYADVTAAANELGWRARIAWEVGIEALCLEKEKDNHG